MQNENTSEEKMISGSGTIEGNEIKEGPFQIEVAFADNATDEERATMTPEIESMLKSLEEEEGNEDGFPAFVKAVTIRRIN